MSSEQLQENERATQRESDETVDESPELQPSRQQRRDHRPDAYTTGYDPLGETRIGIGTANGNIERLIRLNEGRHHSDGNHSTREAARDKKRITQSLCSALDVPAYQQQRAVSAMSQLNLDRFGQQKRIEKVALCTIGIIVDRERRRYFLNGRDPADLNLSGLSAGDFPTTLNEQNSFQGLCESYGVSSKDRYRVTGLVKQELKRIGFFERENQPLKR